MSTDLDETTGYDAPPTRSARHHRRRWYAHPLLVIVAVTAVAGGLRFSHLSFPHEYVFDEVYYAKDGCFDAGFPFRQCHLDSPGEQTSTVHPPLGRWIIAGGEVAFGNGSLGWRFSSAVAGTMSVAFLTILAWRLFGSILWGGISGLLLATENLNFVQSRMSMLDIFVAAFIVLGFLFLVLDREWIDRRTPLVPDRSPEESPGGIDLPPDRAPSPILRPWRVAAGITLGAAAATKWSGGLALVAALILSLAWERTRRSRLGIRRPLLDAIRAEGFGIFVFLVLVPIAVYLASYLRFWVDNGFDTQAIADWWKNQQGMASYSLHLRATHPYASRAWSWVLLKRPVSYYYVCHRTGSVCARPAEILAVGNPLIFWGSVFTIPYALWAWFRRKEWRAGLIVVAFLVQYLPWFGAARTSFLFYMTPITPFMVLAGVYAVRDIADRRSSAGRRSALSVGIASFLIATSIAMFVFFLPVLTGRTTSYDQWRARMWYGKCLPKPTWCWI